MICLELKMRFFACFLTIAMLLCACAEEDAPLEFPEQSGVTPKPDEGVLIRGRVFWDADEPPRGPKLLVSDRFCQSVRPEYRDQSVRVQDGGLGQVLVFVESGAEAFAMPHQRDEAVLDQRDCLFVPAVLAIRTHQPLRIQNSDPIAHNINTKGSARGQGFVRTTASQGESIRVQFREPELDLPVLCDFHPWMRARIHVVSHPWFALTNDRGDFTWNARLPVGRYVVVAHHPTLGQKRLSMEVKSGDNRPQSLQFRFP